MPELSLKCLYVDDETLKLTIYVKKNQYNEADIEWSKEAKLYVMDYNKQ